MTVIFEKITDWRETRKNTKAALGFVPTMGALHEGHVALMRRSQSENEKTLVSIFVNPTQFDNPLDFEKYPQTLSEDIKILENVGVDYLLLPDKKEIYKDSYNYQILETDLSRHLCGAHRPGHFKGMLTIVLKLLQIADADNAYFGEKDYQQYLLVKEMADAFFLKTNIIPCPTIREKDGLALSSRNRRLSAEEREKAVLFPTLLKSEFSDEEIAEKLRGAGFKVDYIEKRDGRRFGAVHLGETRLIDNVKI